MEIPRSLLGSLWRLSELGEGFDARGIFPRLRVGLAGAERLASLRFAFSFVALSAE
jgi:hypothetical protein